MKEQNTNRKEIQKQITTDAMKQARVLDKTKSSLCILLENGHAGIHGISASRLKDTFGKPIIIFSETQTDSSLVAGSARSTDDIHIKSILDEVAKRSPDLIIKYGGHKGAAGLTIKKSDFKKFYECFESCILEEITKQNLKLEPFVEYDFELEENEFNLATFSKIESLEPFGREFDKPVFCNDFTVESFRLVGKDKIHAQMVLRVGNTSVKSIWFNATDNPIVAEISIGDNIKACYQLQKKSFLDKLIWA